MQRFRLFLLVAGFAVLLMLVAGMAYCVLTGQWLPAIFWLLVANAVSKWVDRISDETALEEKKAAK